MRDSTLGGLHLAAIPVDCLVGQVAHLITELRRGSSSQNRTTPLIHVSMRPPKMPAVQSAPFLRITTLIRWRCVGCSGPPAPIFFCSFLSVPRQPVLALDASIFASLCALSVEVAHGGRQLRGAKPPGGGFSRRC